MNDRTVVRCNSASCMARIVLYRISPFVLARFGWVLEMQYGDEVPMPYCSRCAS